MKFNFAQALAILAVTNPVAALQSPDYTDKLAVAARDITPEAAPALPADDVAKRNVEVRDPARRRNRAANLARINDGLQTIAWNAQRIHQDHVAGQQQGQPPQEQTAVQKRDLEAREPRRGGRSGGKGGSWGSKVRNGVEVVAGGSTIVSNAHQIYQNSKQPQQKRDLEAREPRRGGRPGRPGRTGDRVRNAVEIGAGGSEIIRNAHEIYQNSKQTA